MDKVVIGTCSKCAGPVTIAGPNAYQCERCGTEYGRDVVGEYGVVVGQRKPKALVFFGTSDAWSECSTPFGAYSFYKFDRGYIVVFERVKVAEFLKTEQEAIAAAQADYDKRCGECFE